MFILTPGRTDVVQEESFFLVPRELEKRFTFGSVEDDLDEFWHLKQQS